MKKLLLLLLNFYSVILNSETVNFAVEIFDPSSAFIKPHGTQIIEIYDGIFPSTGAEKWQILGGCDYIEPNLKVEIYDASKGLLKPYGTQVIEIFDGNFLQSGIKKVCITNVEGLDTDILKKLRLIDELLQ